MIVVCYESGLLLETTFLYYALDVDVVVHEMYAINRCVLLGAGAATLAALAAMAAPLLRGRRASGKAQGRVATLATVASLSTLAAAAVLLTVLLTVFARIDPGAHWHL